MSEASGAKWAVGYVQLKLSGEVRAGEICESLVNLREGTDCQGGG